MSLDEIWSWLMLAEVFLMNKEMDSCLEALEKGQGVGEVIQCFTALPAAMIELRPSLQPMAHWWLPVLISQMIWLDLEEKVSNYCIDLNGDIP